MSKISEAKSVEAPIYAWLGQMGWQPRSSEDLKAYHRPISNPVIEGILIDRIATLNRVSIDEARRASTILLSTFQTPSVAAANEQFLRLVREGVTLTVAGRDQTLKLVDFDNIWDNDFTVTRQYWVQGSELVKPDIACLINGIPLIPFEAKQRSQQGSNWLKGVGDLAVYNVKVPKLVICNLFGIACNGRTARYGVPGHSASYFAEWKDTSVDPTPGNPLLLPAQTLCPIIIDPSDGLARLDVPDYERMKQTVLGLLQPGRVIRLLRSYVVFEQS
jgi:type I restriction enzyme R subunit